MDLGRILDTQVGAGLGSSGKWMGTGVPVKEGVWSARQWGRSKEPR
jgi:hypothetical protein